MDRTYCAIVAEYREVAILEKKGDIKKVWKGVEYFTDGKYYAISKRGKDLLVISTNTEFEMKGIIDCYYDSPELVKDLFKDSKLLSYKEVWKIIYKNEHKGDVPTYVYDEELKAFISVIKDGQHQHGRKE